VIVTDSRDLISAVTTAADEAQLHAPAPTMLLKVQTLLGELAAVAMAATEHGRRPFRADAHWDAALGALGFAVYHLGDQTGVDVTAAILTHAAQLRERVALADSRDEPAAWPFGS
jgi:hypothetical protein